MICDKCDYDYEIGAKGEYRNTYGTRCPKCNHLIKPLEEATFIRQMKEKKQKLVNKFLPAIRKKMTEDMEENKNAN